MQTETFRDPGAETFRDPGADREIQKHTETFRDPEADRDVRRSRSKQKHSEIQEWTAWRIELSTIVSQAEYR